MAGVRTEMVHIYTAAVAVCLSGSPGHFLGSGGSIPTLLKEFKIQTQLSVSSMIGVEVKLV